MLSSLFHVETLDARFASKTGEPHQRARPSRWNTPEYYLYYLFFLTIPPLMFKSVYDVSKPDHPNYRNYEALLDDGWIPGRKVDNSDSQYSSFRDNIPYMALLVVLHPLLRRLYDGLVARPTIDSATGSTDQGNAITARHADARLQRRVTYDLGFATIYLFALHGVSAFKVFTILYLNFQIATKLPRQYVGATTWIFNIAILFANELCQGYRFGDVVGFVLPPQADVVGNQAASKANFGSWLDSYGGLIPRWEILFNITVLRLIAFNFDHLWSQDRRAGSPVELTDFTFRNYLAYVLYSPLYLTGPIINFNDYISQARYPLATTSRARIIPFAIRFLFCLLMMEVVQHFLYAVAISKSNPDWSQYTPFQLSMLGYFNLHIVWLKLLLPWRFFRLWSLLDGVDPPENVGTSKIRAVANYAAVFTFVALWHDINLRLLVWGWLVVIFVAPEVLARMLFPAKAWANKPNAYRWLGGVGAVGNILMMMSANLVGFAVGLDGLKGLIDGIITSFWGRVFFVGACATLFVGSQVMFEWREAEMRRGVDMKC
nr:glycerol uptake protein 1 [Quercus suber]